MTRVMSNPWKRDFYLDTFSSLTMISPILPLTIATYFDLFIYFLKNKIVLKLFLNKKNLLNFKYLND
jgi:hypothetical protein